MESYVKEFYELLIWKYQLQMKTETYQSCLDKLSNGKAVYDRIVFEKCTFWVKSAKHEMFLIDQLIDELLNQIDISDATKILANEP